MPVTSLRAAAELLASADSTAGLAAIARSIGCDGDPALLDDATRRGLGLDGAIAQASIASGAGSLRALLVTIADAGEVRNLLPRLAARLATRAPHVLWIVLARQPALDRFTIAAWSGDRRPPRIAAMVVDRRQVVDSDAETLRALTLATGDSDVLVHGRWVETLGRDSLTARFYRDLERAVSSLANSSPVGTEAERRDAALLDASRLIFLSFLEAKRWLDGDGAFLARQFERCLADGGRFRERVLRPLFFGTLNTPVRKRARAALAFGRIPFLNGGLFARAAIELSLRGLTFSDDAYGSLIFDVFGQYRFTAREETATWNEAAVDPEMLGRAFESLMAWGERRRTGAFFTPFSLVERLTASVLSASLGSLGDRALSGERLPAGARTTLLQALDQLTVLDPACGSGAFLVHVLERIASLRASAGDSRDVSEIRRHVLTRSIFGVDLNPTAVWLCELRLWLSVVIESDADDPRSVTPLPNLDRNIRVGDALGGRGFGASASRAEGGAIRRLRERYARATGQRKASYLRQLERAERAHALAEIDGELKTVAEKRRDVLTAQRERDLFGRRHQPTRDERAAAGAWKRRSASLRALRRRLAGGGALPFSFATHFGDVAARGGFTLVVGNPPWVRAHRVPEAQRAAYRREYVVARSAAWEPGASVAGAGRGFAAQVDVAALFVERAVKLCAPGGTIGLLLPVKLWRSLAGGGVRAFVASSSRIVRVEDHAHTAGGFDAAVYPSLLIAKRHADDASRAPPKSTIDISVHDGRSGAAEWRLTPAQLAFDETRGAPWLLLPPDARRAFDRLGALGRPLAKSELGHPRLGVKCGCNAAFVVEIMQADDEVADVLTIDRQRISVERSMLRPLLKGESLRRWHAPSNCDAIIWTHDERGVPLRSLPTRTARWLTPWRRQLAARSDARHASHWWALFRTEAARTNRARVVWGDLGREPRASVLPPGDRRVPLNTCYVMRCPDDADAFALSALLNSPLARAWLDAIAEPARGGYKRYFGWTMSLLPVPSDWPRARELLAPLGECGANGDPPSDQRLLDASLEAYGIDGRSVAPLVAWTSAR